MGPAQRRRSFPVLRVLYLSMSYTNDHTLILCIVLLCTNPAGCGLCVQPGLCRALLTRLPPRGGRRRPRACAHTHTPRTRGVAAVSAWASARTHLVHGRDSHAGVSETALIKHVAIHTQSFGLLACTRPASFPPSVCVGDVLPC